MVSNLAVRTPVLGTICTAAKTPETAVRPTSEKTRPSFLTSLLKALSAFAV